MLMMYLSVTEKKKMKKVIFHIRKWVLTELKQSEIMT